MSFSNVDKLKAMAIVRVFETGKAAGDYAACAVLDDGAGISYGISQFTHRSGSLLAAVEIYLKLGGKIGREIIAKRLPILRRTTKQAIEKLAADEQFKKALKAAAITHEMREAQEAVAFEKYLNPAIDECTRLGFTLPLSLAVVYDSIVHGSWEKIRDAVRVTPSGVSADSRSVTQTAEAVTLAFEKRWITNYVRRRHLWLRGIPRLRKTSYRTEFFLRQIATGKWNLELPMVVHGVRLTDDESVPPAVAGGSPQSLENVTRSKNQPPAIAGGTDKTPPAGEPAGALKNPPADAGGSDPDCPPKSSRTGRVRQGAAPAEEDKEKRSGGEGETCLNKIEEQVNSVAEKIDQVDRIVTTTQTRTDKAKSLWTTIAGTSWQMLWAVAGFLAGVPREVWLVVAVIAGLLMLMYLYRQIALGRIREQR